MIFNCVIFLFISNTLSHVVIIVHFLLTFSSAAFFVSILEIELFYCLYPVVSISVGPVDVVLLTIISSASFFHVVLSFHVSCYLQLETGVGARQNCCINFRPSPFYQSLFGACWVWTIKT